MSARPRPLRLPLSLALEYLTWSDSRRALTFIHEGLVVVNGRVMADAEHVVDVLRDEIDVAGEPLTTGAAKTIAVVLNKPIGYAIGHTNHDVGLFEMVGLRDLGWHVPYDLPMMRAGLMLLTTDNDHADVVASPWSLLTTTNELRNGTPTCVRLGPFRIEDLQSGSWQRLTGHQVAALDAMLASGIADHTPLEDVWNEIARAAREHERGGSNA